MVAPVNVAQLQDQHRTSVIIKWQNPNFESGDPPVPVDATRGLMYAASDGSVVAVDLGGLNYNQIIEAVIMAIQSMVGDNGTIGSGGLFTSVSDYLAYSGITYDVDYQDGVLYGISLQNVPVSYWVWIGASATSINGNLLPNTVTVNYYNPYMLLPTYYVNGDIALLHITQVLQWGSRPLACCSATPL